MNGIHEITGAFAGDGAAWAALGIVAGTGAWLLRDGLRLIAHLRAADRLIATGMPEPEALRTAGCLFWQTPWYRRLFRRYPALRT